MGWTSVRNGRVVSCSTFSWSRKRWFDSVHSLVCSQLPLFWHELCALGVTSTDGTTFSLPSPLRSDGGVGVVVFGCIFVLSFGTQHTAYT